MSFHKLDKAKDKNFWSVRVNSDIRLIVHRSEQSLFLCYAVSVFSGPSPIVRSLKSEADETKAVGAWIAEQAKSGVIPHEFGVFVRSEAQSACREDAKDSHPARKRIGEALWTGFGAHPVEPELGRAYAAIRAPSP